MSIEKIFLRAAESVECLREIPGVLGEDVRAIRLAFLALSELHRKGEMFMPRVPGELHRIVWYARGAGIARSGPYPDQVSAVEAMRLVDGDLPSDLFVWPEAGPPGPLRMPLCAKCGGRTDG